jgi:hypothetical protein
MRRQSQLIQRQGQTYAQAQPYYQPLLQQYAHNAGVEVAPGMTQVGDNHYAATPRPGGLGSAWGTPEDQLRFQAQDELARRQRDQGQSALLHSARQQGLSEGTIAAMLHQNQSQYDAGNIGFRRQLAINAPQERERRLALLREALGMGFGQGGAASAGYGQQAGVYGQQAAAANQGTGNILQQWMYQHSLKNYGGSRARADRTFWAAWGCPASDLAPYGDTYSGTDNYSGDQYSLTPRQRAALAMGY